MPPRTISGINSASRYYYQLPNSTSCESIIAVIMPRVSFSREIRSFSPALDDQVEPATLRVQGALDGCHFIES